MSIYQKLKKAGVEISGHYSDLYCPVNPVTNEILKDHKCKSIFISQIDGEKWWDVPFQFDPYWEKRGLL